MLVALLTHPASGVPLHRIRLQLGYPDPHSLEQALKVLEETWITLSHRISDDVLSVRIANPSCRDFVLAKVRQTAGYAEALLGMAHSLDELILVLDYARRVSSKMESAPKPPRGTSINSAIARAETIKIAPPARDAFGDAMAASRALVIEKLRAAYETELEEHATLLASRTPIMPRAARDPRPRLLHAVTTVVSQYGSDSDVSWLREQVLLVARDADEWNGAPTNASRLLSLYEAIQRTPRLYDGFDASNLVNGAVRRIEDLDDIEEFDGLTRFLDDDHKYEFVERAEGLLREEYDRLLAEEDDSDQEMSSSADRIEELVEKFDLNGEAWSVELREHAEGLADRRPAAEGPSIPDDEQEEEKDDGDTEVTDDERLRSLFSNLENEEP